MVSKKFKDLTIVRASAAAQAEVIGMISEQVMTRWLNSPEPYTKPVETFILPFVLSMPYRVKCELHNLLLSEVHMKDEGFFDIEHFQNDIMGYHRLLAEVLYWNLEDFFTYTAAAHREQLKK